MNEEQRGYLERKLLSDYGYKKDIVFEATFKQFINSFTNKFEYITCVSTDYIKEGFHGFILIKSKLIMTKKVSGMRVQLLQ